MLRIHTRVCVIHDRERTIIEWAARQKKKKNTILHYATKSYITDVLTYKKKKMTSMCAKPYCAKQGKYEHECEKCLTKYCSSECKDTGNHYRGECKYYPRHPEIVKCEECENGIVRMKCPRCFEVAYCTEYCRRLNWIKVHMTECKLTGRATILIKGKTMAEIEQETIRMNNENEARSRGKKKNIY